MLFLKDWLTTNSQLVERFPFLSQILKLLQLHFGENVDIADNVQESENSQDQKQKQNQNQQGKSEGAEDAAISETKGRVRTENADELWEREADSSQDKGGKKKNEKLVGGKDEVKQNAGAKKGNAEKTDIPAAEAVEVAEIDPGPQGLLGKWQGQVSALVKKIGKGKITTLNQEQKADNAARAQKEVKGETKSKVKEPEPIGTRKMAIYFIVLSAIIYFAYDELYQEVEVVPEHKMKRQKKKDQAKLGQIDKGKNKAGPKEEVMNDNDLLAGKSKKEVTPPVPSAAESPAPVPKADEQEVDFSFDLEGQEQPENTVAGENAQQQSAKAVDKAPASVDEEIAPDISASAPAPEVATDLAGNKKVAEGELDLSAHPEQESEGELDSLLDRSQAEKANASQAESSPQGVGQDINKLSQVVQKVGKEEDKEPELPPPPEYATRGRGLVYNCLGRHWACVEKEEFFQCKEHQTWSTQLHKSPECVIADVYAQEEDCEKMQLYRVDQHTIPKECSE